jgi:hypothetical protein
MIEALRAVFETSVAQFLQRETQNILNGTAERNLCACWAPLLENAAIAAGFEGYRADADYNRMLKDRVKAIMPDSGREIRIVCDLILHSRGELPGHDNLIAIEVKRSSRPEDEKESDRERLRTLTRPSFDGVWAPDGVNLPDYVCGYTLGYYVELDIDTRSFLIEEYVEGALVDSRTRTF